jgi:pimeloyl-ACP methyl ester carboxylesterase
MTQTGMIRTDGASLYYERRGSGPALLMISGGGGDAGYYREVAEHLADAYTVLTYDRRGNSRSTVDDPTASMRLDEQCADARAVLAHHDHDLASALVFGGSGGAIIGLDLAARHGSVVEALIAHEPPPLSHLSTVEHEMFADIADIARREGPWSAYARFITSIDRDDSPALVRKPVGRRVVGGLMKAGSRVFAHGPRNLREVARFMGNGEYLIMRELAPFLAFEPDYEALKAAEFPIVIGVGAESRQYYAGRAAAEVAKRLDAPLVDFPGLHAGYAEKPTEFAAALRDTLADLRAPAR